MKQGWWWQTWILRQVSSILNFADQDASVIYRTHSKIQEWFDQYEPFDVKEIKLWSLSSGLTTTEGDDINPHKAKEVGLKIQM